MAILSPRCFAESSQQLDVHSRQPTYSEREDTERSRDKATRGGGSPLARTLLLLADGGYSNATLRSQRKTERAPRVSWFVFLVKHLPPLETIPAVYGRRYSIEHGFRVDKQDVL